MTALQRALSARIAEVGSQKALATKSGVSTTCINEIFLGYKRAGPETCAKLGLPPDLATVRRKPPGSTGGGQDRPLSAPERAEIAARALAERSRWAGGPGYPATWLELRQQRERESFERIVPDALARERRRRGWTAEGLAAEQARWAGEYLERAAVRRERARERMRAYWERRKAAV